ncbi:hypothetical protein AKJ16_DCAP10931 [Drosera capensis]
MNTSSAALGPASSVYKSGAYWDKLEAEVKKEVESNSAFLSADWEEVFAKKTEGTCGWEKYCRRESAASVVRDRHIRRREAIDRRDLHPIHRVSLENAILRSIGDQPVAAAGDAVGEQRANDVYIQQERNLLAVQGMESAAEDSRFSAGSQAHVWTSLFAEIVDCEDGSR